MKMVVNSMKAFTDEPSKSNKPVSHVFSCLSNQSSLQLQQHHFPSFQQYCPQREISSSQATVGDNVCQEEELLIMMMQESPPAYVHEVNPSPGYMDTDVQFNYPEDQCSHVKVEPHTLDESKQFPNGLSNPSKIQRQYSLLSTLMEVIDDHDINDVNSTFSATPVSSEPNRTLKTHPINIQRPTANHMPSFNQNAFDSPTLSGTPGSNLTTNNSPLPCRQHCNNFGASQANSPMNGMPFSRYQQKDVFVSSPPEYGMKMCPPNAAMVQSHSPQTDQMTLTFQATEDLMSPSQSVVSPCTWQQPKQQAEVLSAANTRGNVFVFDNFQNQHFKPSQSCPNFNHGSNMNADIPTCSGQNIELVPYPPKTHSNMSSVPSPSTPGSAYSFSSPSFDQAQLEEVDYVPFKYLNLGRPLTEQERLDVKRIRNNIACQASRERRKRRKVEKEAQARNLEAENLALRQQIRKLELDVKSAHECVKRRMSQS